MILLLQRVLMSLPTLLADAGPPTPAYARSSGRLFLSWTPYNTSTAGLGLMSLALSPATAQALERRCKGSKHSRIMLTQVRVLAGIAHKQRAPVRVLQGVHQLLQPTASLRIHTVAAQPCHPGG